MVRERGTNIPKGIENSKSDDSLANDPEILDWMMDNKGKEVLTEEDLKRETVEFELAANAQGALKGFLELKEGERLAIISGETSDQKVLEILRKAAEKIGAPLEELVVSSNTKKAEIEGLFKRNPAVIDISRESADLKAAEDMWDEEFLQGAKSRFAYDPGLTADMFEPGGALTENIEDLQDRLNRMEATLRDAVGFHITSSYGTDLTVALRSDKERRWYKDTGVIKEGKYDNMPGGEIFTTPDQYKVNGVLVLPYVDLYTDIPQQGVDELVRLTFRDGVITEILGGESAERLRQQLEKAAREQNADAETRESHSRGWLMRTKTDETLSRRKKREKSSGIISRANEKIAAEHNPYNPYRIAEIAFGANRPARSVDEQGPYNRPAVSVVELEKRFGTMHFAVGDSEHGEEGASGFYQAVSHLDFVLPRNGLTVEMFTDQDQLRKNKGGRKIIDEGRFNLI